MFKKIIYLNFCLFYFLVFAFFGLTIIEAIHFAGYITVSFNISLKPLFVLIVMSGLLAEGSLYRFTKEKDKSDFIKFFMSVRFYFYEINKSFLIVLFIFGSIFLLVRKGIYIDFVKSSVGLNPLYIWHLLGLSLFVLILGRIFPINYKIKQPKPLSSFWNKMTLEILLIIMLLISQTVLFYSGTTQWWFKGLVESPFANHDQKMYYVYGSFYNYMKFVNSNTPSNAVIMRMKQDSKWPWLSNDPFTRYFIYPRYTKEGDKNSFTDPSIKYVFVHKQYPDANDPGAGERWPDFKVPAKRVLYMRDNDFTKEPIIVNGDYDPKDKTHEKLWGLIEVKGI